MSVLGDKSLNPSPTRMAVAALDSSWRVVKEAAAKGQVRPEHKTEEMAVNDHEEKFRDSMMDAAATQANTPLKNLIEQSLPSVDSHRKNLRVLLDNAGVAHAAPNAKKVTGPLEKVLQALDTTYRELNSHTESSMGPGFKGKGESSGDPLNLDSTGGALGYSMDALRDAGNRAGQSPEQPF